TIPNCKAYAPAFAGEMAGIVHHGMKEMLADQRDVFYYVTLMNENYAQPDVPSGSESDLVRGCYRFATIEPVVGKKAGRVTLLGSGAILTEVLKAADLLAAEGIGCDVFSVTSWSELARDGIAREQEALAGEKPAAPFVTKQLSTSVGPIIAATDYVRAVPDSIRAFVPAGRRYLTLGTDGFGRSDTRAALREFFHVNAAHIANAARYALGQA
ncbi:MAG: pyruvate dehydrogenase (acetyl-transferring), homodimeric type, partial [Ramlibacter sp.]|nr:pyruvate dehydrogenase (acetyl-transferring), homodimeric type [Ramlibacter sp.]